MRLMEDFEPHGDPPDPISTQWLNKHGDAYEFRLKSSLRRGKRLSKLSPRTWLEPGLIPLPQAI